MVEKLKYKHYSKVANKRRTLNKRRKKTRGGYKMSDELNRVLTFLKGLTAKKSDEIISNIIKDKIVLDPTMEMKDSIEIIVVNMQEYIEKLDELADGKNPFKSDKERNSTIKYLIDNIENYKQILGKIPTIPEGKEPSYEKGKDIIKDIASIRTKDIEAYEPQDKTVTISFYNRFLEQMKSTPTNALGKIVLSVKDGTSTLHQMTNSVTDVDELMATIHYGLKMGDIKPFYRKRFNITKKNT